MSVTTQLLAIESSCDETAASVVRGPEILSNVIASQVEVHAKFGGVVPEIASREHMQAVVGVVTQALAQAELELEDLDAIAVTHGPGLVGALLIGVQMARGLATAQGLPLWGIHHHEGHLASARVVDDAREDLEMRPHLALLVSGGHTTLVDVQGLGRYQILGQTRDDAVGEAFDKSSKHLGLGYPGGPIVDSFAQKGRGDAVDFPRAMLHQDNLDLSFSGLKTAMALHLKKHGQPQSKEALCDICASFQEAVAEALTVKTRRALAQSGHKRLHVVGGAAANTRIRAMLEAMTQELGVELRCAPLRYCGDNAAMIGLAANMRLAAGLAQPVKVQSYIDLETLSEELDA